MMPNHSPPPGQYPIGVALVSGPRIVTPTLPSSRLTTNSQRLTAIERNGSAPSLWLRQTRSTKGESDALSSSKIIILLLPPDEENTDDPSPSPLTCIRFL